MKRIMDDGTRLRQLAFECQGLNSGQRAVLAIEAAAAMDPRKGLTRLVADAAGIGTSTISRVRIATRRCPEMFEKIRRGEVLANEAQRATGGSPKINRKTPDVRVQEIRKYADLGFNSFQIAQAIGFRADRVRALAKIYKIEVDRGKRLIDMDRVLDETITAAQGIADVKEIISVNDIPPEKLEEWILALNTARVEIGVLIKSLKRRRRYVNSNWSNEGGSEVPEEDGEVRSRVERGPHVSDEDLGTLRGAAAAR